ncbi:hypothetical protein BWR15_10630 [Pseudomonas sp. T]|nr:hypothetical protein BWR15_10630 [Pseudomonas sp. T]
MKELTAPERPPVVMTADLKRNLRSWLTQQRSSYSNYYVNEALDLLENADSSTDWPARSRSYNGYVRELAVRALACHRSQDALHTLLERANDWVPSVREQALLGIESYLEEDQVFLLLQNLPRLLTLSRQQRGDHRTLLLRIQALLAKAEHASEVRATWFGLRGQASRFLFGLLADSDASSDLLLQALRHPDPVVRTMTLEAGRHLSEMSRQQLLLAALHNHSATVRGRALRLLVDEAMPHHEALEGGLLDSSASVRSMALWYAQRSNIQPTQTLARRVAGAMPATTSNWLGVLGLSTTLGQPVPSEWREAALRSTSARVRLAAILQSDDTEISVLMELLDDASPKVFRGAMMKLVKLPWQTLQQPVCQYLERHWKTLEATRRDLVFRLLAYWQRMEFLLNKVDKEQNSNYWLNELRAWSYQRYPALDSLTSREERRALGERIKHLVNTGQLPKDSLTCID